MKYKREIKDWTKKFAVVIIKACIELRIKGVEYALRNQLLRSGTSIGSNVNEARASSSRKELIRYYEIALRSCDETEYWLDVIKEGYSMNDRKFEIIKVELKEITKVIAAIVIKLK